MLLLPIFDEVQAACEFDAWLQARSEDQTRGSVAAREMRRRFLDGELIKIRSEKGKES